jgi:hypothetical protein
MRKTNNINELLSPESSDTFKSKLFKQAFRSVSLEIEAHGELRNVIGLLDVASALLPHFSQSDN